MARSASIRVAHDAATEAPRFALLNIEWSYQLDPLSSIFMLIVTGVGLCIFVFATGYMHGETGFYRFFAYMGLFMFAMLVLVMGSNFLMMFVGWEGVGLCSYLLIGYYFDRQEAANASRKAFITNRVGDFGFALAIFGIIATFGSAQYTEVFEPGESFPDRTARSLGHSLLDRARTLYRRLRKVCTTSTARLAAGCDGWSNTCLRADPRCDDGDCRTLHGDAHQRHLPALANDAARRRACRRRDCDLRRHDRHHAERHQESSRLLNRLAARLYVHGLWRGRVCDRHLSRDDARVLQGADVPRRGQRDSRHASRAGHASHGRFEEVHALHVLDVHGRLACDLRHHSVQWLLVQRRNSLEGSFDDTHPAWLARLAGRHDRGYLHGVLHDAPDGDDVLG